MADSNTATACTECDGSGERYHPNTNTQDQLANVCPFCAGTGQKLQLNASHLTQILMGKTTK